jgi:HB1, ASXL, restriction endonuclease HTH domain
LSGRPHDPGASVPGSGGLGWAPALENLSIAHGMRGHTLLGGDVPRSSGNGAAGRKPTLTAREITDIALERGLLRTSGKTPEATMSARLYAAPADALIRREFASGRQRAVRGSVRWVYVERKR